MKKIYTLRRIGLLLIVFASGALISGGDMPNWMKAFLSISGFGLFLIYSEVSYDTKKDLLADKHK